MGTLVSTGLILLAVAIGTTIIRRNIMTDQAKVDQIAVRLEAIAQQQSQGVADVIAEIQKVKDANPVANFAAVDEAIVRLAAGSQALDDITPALVADEPTTPAEPETTEPETETPPVPAPAPSDEPFGGNVPAETTPEETPDESETTPDEPETPSSNA